MKSFSSWVLAIVIALCVLGLVAYDRPSRQAYWVARTAQIVHSQATPEPTPSISRIYIIRR